MSSRTGWAGSGRFRSSWNHGLVAGVHGRMEVGKKAGEVRHLGVAVIDQEWAEEIGCACWKNEPTAHLTPFSCAADRVDKSAFLSAAFVVATPGGRADHGSVVGVVERLGV